MTATNLAIVTFSSYLTVSSITGSGAKLNPVLDAIILNAFTKATKGAILEHWEKRVKVRILDRLEEGSARSFRASNPIARAHNQGRQSTAFSRPPRYNLW